MAAHQYSRFQSFNILLFTIVAVSTIGNSNAYMNVLSPYSSKITTDVGNHLIIPCNVSGDPTPHITWLKDGQLLFFNVKQRHPILDRQGLLFFPLFASDSGNYSCIATNQYDLEELNTELVVKTTPAKLTNVSVHASTVVATVRWHVRNDGGHPITNFTLLYKVNDDNVSDSWHLPQPVHISPAMRQFFIYQLKPGTSYSFKIWATNRLGPGEVVTVQARTCQPTNEPEVFGKMLTQAENFGPTAWLLAVCMLAVTVLALSLLSFALVYREQRSASMEDAIPRIITNPGFEIDIEQCFLLESADFNDNIEKPIRVNNNTIILPSRV